MNIGFFGDSYVDINLDFYWAHPDTDVEEEKYFIWAARVCRDLKLVPVNSGLGGSNQFYAIKQWQDYIINNNVDIAVFNFTWDHRLYSPKKDWQHILSSFIEKKDLEKIVGEVPNDIDDIRLGIDLYFRYLQSKEQSLFVHEQLIRWILELPEKYPNIKFIFLPNTEVSREIAVRHFKNGVLVDFAFETISLMEGERVGIDPFNYEKPGHLTNINHNRFKEKIKDIIVNWTQHKDKIYSLDYDEFRI
jgi:hypothetical protein